jgi:aminoglycoside/choline kinase family phosphotransferase
MDAPPEKEDSAAFIKIATLLRTNNLVQINAIVLVECL